MEFCQSELFLHSPAAQQLESYVQKRSEQWASGNALAAKDNFEHFEQEVHRMVMALECELMRTELSRYDLDVPEIEVGGQVYRRGARLSESYLTAAGRISVERNLYAAVDAAGKSLYPLEVQSGIIAGYFTARAARQGAFAMAHLTPGESEALFGEIGNMQPSRSSLDRLSKALSPHWEENRVAWEAQLRQSETVPEAAKIVVFSVDGVMSPIREADNIVDPNVKTTKRQK